MRQRPGEEGEGVRPAEGVWGVAVGPGRRPAAAAAAASPPLPRHHHHHPGHPRQPHSHGVVLVIAAK